MVLNVTHFTTLSWSFVFPRKEKDSFPACHAGADAWSSGPEAGGLAWTVLADSWAVSTQVLVAMVGNAICAIRTDCSSILAYVNVNCGLQETEQLEAKWKNPREGRFGRW